VLKEVSEGHFGGTGTLASSPGRISRTAVWISRDEMVDFLLYEANLEASPATRSKISFTGHQNTEEKCGKLDRTE
jgi:hypothetical protein